MTNKFKIVSPMYNASKTLSRMLCSIMGQSYKNWELILIDDISDAIHRPLQTEIIDTFNELDRLQCATNERIKVIWNQDKKWEIENVLQGLKLCDDDDIIVRVDCDDFISDLDAFRIINEYYIHTKCEMLWTAHRWHDNERITSQNISDELPEGANPYKHAWVSSHLRTHRKFLLNDVKDENYRGEDGKYFKRIGDQTFALPALHNSKKNIYLPMVMYSYFCPMQPSNFQTQDAKFQKAEAEFLRKRGYVK